MARGVLIKHGFVINKVAQLLNELAQLFSDHNGVINKHSAVIAKVAQLLNELAQLLSELA